VIGETSGRLRLVIAASVLSLTACSSAVVARDFDASIDRHAHSPAVTSPTSTPGSASSPSAQSTPSSSPAPALPQGTPPVHHTPMPTPTPAPAPGNGPRLGGCSVFPTNNPWNQDISQAPLNPNSANYIASINANRQYLHADFGSNPSYGIPYVLVPGSQPFVPITFTAYGSESDPGPYPVPLNAPVEQGSDAHVLVADTGNCHLYELFNAHQVGNGWNADSGAVFDLQSNALRPDTWTSADAAGLPILPGLARFDEVQAGAIDHALRFTVDCTQKGFIHPATHQAGSCGANAPPMGLRLRLKASFDVSHFHGEALVILAALKRYGMIVADNGSSWFISGATDSRWDDNDLNQLKTVSGSAFEAVQTGPILH
jgi:hypothetical protein